jgi:small conductance mechanosensitive channel
MNDNKRSVRSLWISKSDVRRPVITKDALLSLDAKIKPDFKKAVGYAFVAITCLIVGDQLGGIKQHDHLLLVAIGVALGFLVFGTLAVRSAARETFRITAARSGPATGSALRLVLSVIGYGLVGLGCLQLANVNLQSLLVGGAVTGVIIGIAAQQSLGNFFAGLVLMFARPYIPGQRVVIRSGAMGGPFEGTIVEAGLAYTTLVTEDGPINLPNAGLLAAAVGPAPEREPVDPSGPTDPTPPPGTGPPGSPASGPMPSIGPSTAAAVTDD